MGLRHAKTAQYLIGSHSYSLLDLEVRAIRSAAPDAKDRFAKSDPRAEVTADSKLWDPRINFALSTGNQTGPRLLVFRAGADLDLALYQCTHRFLLEHVKMAFHTREEDSRRDSSAVDPLSLRAPKQTLECVLPALLDKHRWGTARASTPALARFFIRFIASHNTAVRAPKPADQSSPPV